MNKTASFTIGRISGVHGLNGNLKVISYAHSIETFSKGNTVQLTGRKHPPESYVIQGSHPYKKGILLQLEGVDSRNPAEDLVGKEIVIDRSQLPEPDEDTWYWEDLTGMEVIDTVAGSIGRVSKLFSTGAHDILVVMNGDDEVLIPMHDHFVASVDEERQTIQVDLPENYLSETGLSE